MAFKRAGWHSGLTYRVTCDMCKTTILYMDDKLDFRPWFADGFIYCPTCKKPIRHRESHAINANENNVVVDVTGNEAVQQNGLINNMPNNAPNNMPNNVPNNIPNSEPNNMPNNMQNNPIPNGGSAQATYTNRFCTQCGKEFGANDRFCSGCGTPRT